MTYEFSGDRIDLILQGDINPGKVFERPPLKQATEEYAAMKHCRQDPAASQKAADCG